MARDSGLLSCVVSLSALAVPLISSGAPSAIGVCVCGLVAEAVIPLCWHLTLVLFLLLQQRQLWQRILPA